LHKHFGRLRGEERPRKKLTANGLRSSVLAVAAASKGVTAAVGAIPVVGPFLDVGAGALLAAVGTAIVEAIHDLLDTKDDFVGEVSLVVTPKAMITMTRTPPKDFRAIQWHMDLPLISSDGASYKVYTDTYKQCKWTDRLVGNIKHQTGC
jgi:hypothetical protein